MRSNSYQIESVTSYCHFGARFEDFIKVLEPSSCVLMIDENVYKFHASRFTAFRYLIVPSGEKSKSFDSVISMIDRLIDWETDKQHFLVAVGGGVTCDLAGFVAGIFKRGIRLAYFPTTLLAMVDAAIGGKNGINAGGFKNMVGLVRQPEHIFYDLSLLDTLPDSEWRNGFSEIIKHAALFDREMFEELFRNHLDYWKNTPASLETLIEKNAALKMKVVMQDPYEKNIRKWLNFGHTFGHAIELYSGIPHGEAISIGMRYAATLSMKLTSFPQSQYGRLISLLQQYGLPTETPLNLNTLMNGILQDKKRADQKIDFILLNRIAEPVIMRLDLDAVVSLIQNAEI